MLLTIAFLSIVGAGGALLLFTVAKKFKVEEDPRIEQVTEALPGANCGGCGYPGCGGFASACVGSKNLDGLYCPVGGNPTMAKVADILGMVSVQADPMVAVVRCNGNCDARPRFNTFDGARSCKVATTLYGGETKCSYGCHGFGDCVVACDFDAIHINPETRLPEVDEEKCTACGACVKACPKFIIELRKKGPKGRRIFVSCVNKDKGGAAKKACSNACIGCSLCFKECPFEAITMGNNLSYIDYKKCRMCRKCVSVCPTGAIHEIGFPPKKERKPIDEGAAKAAATKAEAAQKRVVQPKKNDEGTGTPMSKPILETSAEAKGPGEKLPTKQAAQTTTTATGNPKEGPATDATATAIMDPKLNVEEGRAGKVTPKPSGPIANPTQGPATPPGNGANPTV